MTQRIFDVENEKDMADLWDILPDKITKITKPEIKGLPCFSGYDSMRTSDLIKINWHDKAEIIRPIKEATKADVGKICAFWENGWDYFVYAELSEILPERKSVYRYIAGHEKNGYEHCRRLTKQEIEELC